MKRQITALLAGSLCVCSVCLGQAGINLVTGNFADWNQPADYANPTDNWMAPPDGPTGGVTNWCSPTAAANIMGWFEDNSGDPNLMGIADGYTAPNAETPYPDNGVADGSPDYQQNQWHDGTMELGYWMDTQGWQSGSGSGTPQNNLPGGLQSYIGSAVPMTQWTIWNHPWTGSNGAAGWQDYLGSVMGTPTLPPVTTPPTNGITSNDPVLISWDTWVTPGTGAVGTQGQVEWYNWSQTSGEPHCTTGVGYAANYDPDGPSGGLPATDWVIVYDNWPSTGATTGGLVGVPFWTQQSTTLWRNTTHLEYEGFIPEPSVAMLMLVFLAGSAGCRYRLG